MGMVRVVSTPVSTFMKTSIPAATASLLPVVLDFKGNLVRFVGTADNPEWVATDVCKALGLANPRTSLALLDNEDKGVHRVDTLGGKQALTTVYEAGLYQLILTSRKPEAKPFKKWMCGEVLPSIRKFGTYPPPADSVVPQQPQLKHWSERVRETWNPHERYVRKHFPGMFTVASEIALQIMIMEDILHMHNMSTRGEDRPDVSIGRKWTQYRHEQGWHDYPFTAPLRLNEQGIKVMVRVYPQIELKDFHRWFSTIYMPNNFVSYLDNKCEFKPYEPLVRASVADYACLEVTGSHARIDATRQKQLAEHGGVYKSPRIIPVAPKRTKQIAGRPAK